MAPRNLVDASPVPVGELYEDTAAVEEEPKVQVPIRIVWRNVFLFSLLHISAVYGIFLIPQAKLLTIAFAILLYIGSAMGITAGAHRLWSHRSYKARLPLRTFLACLQSLAFQNDIIEWVRDHRVHHKYSETDADPHNALRGFFFAHIGWLLVRKHPDVKTKGKQIDLSDLYADPVCVYQRKFYYPSVLLFCFILPTLVPWYFWGESIWVAYVICALLRYCAALNATWLVNSAAHLYGNRPYDKNINPRENRMVAFGAIGEGFHNFHHTFPHDYSTSEFGWRNCLNLTTAFLDLMAVFGQVYDRRKISPEVVMRRKLRTGEVTDK
ncbi:acyl-CoA desaturase isoform X2 [Lingula anatina]|nr:acyl-CoA desaturase isoform X2 [Lingula anatina]XP_013412661.1 acyl-CoA desaturase isoform X2 [Lingula anatina]|eukprot:XP_013412660.1 acyl-CoA desaturase isoform X2 [Lingula anatina]